LFPNKFSSLTPNHHIHNILHYVKRDDPLGGYPANPSANDDQYDNWEYGVQGWKEETVGLLIESQGTTTPTETENEN
jgi:hypothetical protein